MLLDVDARQLLAKGAHAAETLFMDGAIETAEAILGSVLHISRELRSLAVDRQNALDRLNEDLTLNCTFGAPAADQTYGETLA